eukprot:TRINITY_DN7030_c0_g1_i1.p1 TRINITY_DN7030_c0_g1~~TRINITY_DN7030_c0_g1_i1.p1  ORF type:complete len:313 (-),score=91.38 TRINITY_DN7030_c0_g1_i1:52-990(-)
MLSEEQINEIINLLSSIIIRSDDDEYNNGGEVYLRERISEYTNNNEQIKFFFAGFPFKSPSPEKTIGKAMDKSEEISIDFLSQWIEKFNEIYERGANLTILSDGRVYNDLLGVDNEDVDNYNKDVRQYANSINSKINWFSMNDIFNKNNELTFDQVRESFMGKYGVTVEELKELIKTDPNKQKVYDVYRNSSSRDAQNKTEEELNQIALTMMLRHDALNNMTKEYFESYIRLSIHKTTNNKKYGIQLVKDVCNLTPWHSSPVLLKNNRWTIMKRIDAESQLDRFQAVYGDDDGNNNDNNENDNQKIKYFKEI